MLIDNNKRRFHKLGALAVGAISLGAVALPLSANAQVYFDFGPAGVSVGSPGPYYYGHHYWQGYPGYSYRPYGYYGW